MDLLNSLITPSQEELVKPKALLGQLSQSSQQTQPETNTAVAAAVMLPNPDHEVVLTHRAGPNLLEVHSDEGSSRLGVITGALEDDDAEMELQDVEDFDLQHPHEPNAKAHFVPISSTAKPKPQPTFVPLQSSNCGSATKFQTTCNQAGMQPDFSYSQAAPERWTATLQLGSQTLSSPVCASKKQAKEAVCQLALSDPSFFTGVPGIKRKSSSAPLRPDVDKSENWIGILFEIAQRKKVAYAVYQEYVNDVSYPRQYKCTVTILDAPSTSFGQDLGHFTTKQAAKSSAAKEAVLWLRAQGVIRQSPNKRPCPDYQHVAAMDMEELDSAPVAVRLHRLVILMGFVQPRFDCHLSKTKLGDVQVGVPIYDAAVHFDERDVAREPRLAGLIGRVEQVHGQKKAKEACYEQVLSFLQQLQASRSE